MKMDYEAKLPILRILLLLIVFSYSMKFSASGKPQRNRHDQDYHDHHHGHKHQHKHKQHKGFQINGPRCINDRIGIVGAGPAGIHMAHLLKQKGFKHITIFEKSNRIGGKSKTVNYRGVPQEMGTVNIGPDYEEIVKLVKKFTNDSLLHVADHSVWLDKFPRPISIGKYFILQIMKTLKTRNVTVALMSARRAILKYNKLHKQLFGDYMGELMPRPNARVFHAVRGTFMEYLKRHHLESLQPFFLASFTMQGYGYIDEVAAVYGLFWHTPNLMNSLLAKLNNAKSAGLYFLKLGFQHLWTSMVKEENQNIKYSKDIRRVYRSKKGTWLCTKNCKCKHFDFVVWTPELKTSFKMFHPVKKEEIKLFSKMKPSSYFTTSLVNSIGVRRSQTPIDFWFDNVSQRRKYSVWAQRDSYAAIHGYNGADYQKGLYPSGNDGKPVRTTVVYQSGTSKPTKRQLNDILISQLNTMNATSVKIRETEIWSYFPHFSPSEIQNGILWDILELQGKYGMWYAGSSVIFESVKSVVEYNKLLVRLMRPPCCQKDDDDGETNDDISDKADDDHNRNNKDNDDMNEDETDNDDKDDEDIEEDNDTHDEDDDDDDRNDHDREENDVDHKNEVKDEEATDDNDIKPISDYDHRND